MYVVWNHFTVSDRDIRYDVKKINNNNNKFPLEYDANVLRPGQRIFMTTQ